MFVYNDDTDAESNIQTPLLEKAQEFLENAGSNLEMSDFGALVRKYRLTSRHLKTGKALTQEFLAEALSLCAGVEGFSGRTVSNWERGLNLIRERQVLVCLVQVLYEYRGIKLLTEAEELLAAGNYRALTAAEIKQINPHWQRLETTLPDGSPWPTIEEQLALLPPPSYMRLFGLETAVSKLEELLLSEQGASTIAIVGMGGLGKTALAHFVARRLLEAGHFMRVVWLTLDEYDGGDVWETAVSQLRILLLPDQSVALQPSQDLVLVRRLLQRHRHLIVIDNVGTPAAVGRILAGVGGMIGQSRFLLTVRHHPNDGRGNAYFLPMPTLDMASALAFLRYRAEIEENGRFLAAKEADLMDLCRLVGGHPQALRLLSRLGRAMPLSELVNSWQQGGLKPIEELYDVVYAIVWGELTAVEKQLLLVLPCVAEIGGAPEQLQVASGLSDGDFWTAVTSLAAACLLLPNGTLYEQRYGIHSLTRQFLLQMWASETGLPTAAIVANLAYWWRYLTVLGESEWLQIDSERANIFRAVELSLGLSDEKVTEVIREQWLAISEMIFRYVEQRGNGREWVPILEKLVGRFDERSIAGCHLLNRLGELYHWQYQFSQAIMIHQRVVQQAQSIEDEHELALAHLNLGIGYYHAKAYEEALEQGHLALSIFQRLEDAARGYGATLNLLGRIYLAQEQLAKAEDNFRKATLIWHQLEYWSELVRTLNNLALALELQEDFENALDCYSQAKQILTIAPQILDWTLISLSQGTLYFKLQRYTEAAEIFESIDRVFLQEAQQLEYLALALNNLGNVAFVQGASIQAKGYLQESIALWREIDADIALANTLSKLGDAYKALGQLQEAKLCYIEAIDLAAKHPDDAQARQIRDETTGDLTSLPGE